MAKPPPSDPEGDSGPDSNNTSDPKSSTPRDSGEEVEEAENRMVDGERVYPADRGEDAECFDRLEDAVPESTGDEGNDGLKDEPPLPKDQRPRQPAECE